ncbi:MAG: hypothetical protein AABW75_01710 [Nanoarchaeota archaeon]
MVRVDYVFWNFDRRIVEILGRIHIDDCKKINCIIETSRFVFAQSPYFSSRASKSNLDGAQEPEHAPDFSPRVLDISSLRGEIDES